MFGVRQKKLANFNFYLVFVLLTMSLSCHSCQTGQIDNFKLVFPVFSLVVVRLCSKAYFIAFYVEKASQPQIHMLAVPCNKIQQKHSTIFQIDHNPKH